MVNDEKELKGIKLMKTDLVKPDTDDESWENDVYGFECGNWTCKC